MRKERKYRWYIEPQDANTNAALSRVFSEENFYPGIRDENGKPRNVWECNHSFGAFLLSRRQLGFRFKVFVREGNGKMREVNFMFFMKKAGISDKASSSHSRQAVS